MIDVTCPGCGAINRIPAERVGDQGKCGKCKALLPRIAAPVVVTDANFETVVLRAKIPVLLDCWADWCGPCHMLAPTIDALARDYAGRVLVAKLDVDANPATASRFDTRSIPTLVLFRNGEPVNRLVGVQPRGALDAALRPLLAAGV
jgi:thioredoxin 2